MPGSPIVTPVVFAQLAKQQPLLVDEVDHRERHVEQGGDEPRQPVEDLSRGCIAYRTVPGRAPGCAVSASLLRLRR